MSELPPGCRILGRYALFDEIAAGGMATVHLGRLLGPVGFTRTVAVKRLHAQYARDEEFVAMFLDEARLAGRIQHPNVVSTVDVFPAEGELFLVMEYIRGETLSWCARQANRLGKPVPIEVAASAVAGALFGLHAAHEAVSELGEPLDIVHRDVSPHNIMLGVDGVPRVLDFGVAKAASRLQSTRGGQLKGKLSYMAPEQLHGKAERRTDVYAASVVLWELLAGKRLFDGENEAALMMELLRGCSTPPSKHSPRVTRAIDEVVMCGLALEPSQRFATAHEMAVALERAIRPATPREMGEWLTEVSGDRLQKRLRRVAEIESMSAIMVAPGSGSGSTESLAGAPSFGAPDSAAQVMRSGAWGTLQPPSAPGWSGPATSATGRTATSATYVSDTGSARAKPADGRRAILIGVAAAAAIASVVGCAALLLMPSRAPGTAASSQPPTEAPRAAVVTTASNDVLAAPPAASAPATPPDGDGAAASASAAAIAPTAPAPVSRTTGATTPPATKPTAAKKPKAASCDPPYVVDGSGVKRFKPECL